MLLLLPQQTLRHVFWCGTHEACDWLSYVQARIFVVHLGHVVWCISVCRLGVMCVNSQHVESGGIATVASRCVQCTGVTAPGRQRAGSPQRAAGI